MGQAVIIYGKSGAGKTRSLKNFDKDEICLIQCTPKVLPFKGRFEKQMVSSDVNVIRAAMLKAIAGGTKTIVVDDFTYISISAFMAGHRSLKGNASFDLYNNIADQIYILFKSVEELPEDVIVYFIGHSDIDDYGNIKLRTIGKLLDQKVCLEGMVTVCLQAIVENGEHLFETNTDGSSISKSPEEMFPEKKIPNNLKEVDTAIRDFYGIGGK